MKDEPRSLTLYAVLQLLALIFCWGWFAVLWAVAAFNYQIGDFQWWLLVATGMAGLYGLKPNLEKAIDRVWLGNSRNTQALTERVAQLKPIKRRIDVVFSLVLIGILVIGFIVTALLMASGVININGTG